MCGTLSGSFTFTRTKTFPFEPFVTLMMTCDMLKIVLERKREKDVKSVLQLWPCKIFKLLKIYF